MQDPIRPVDNKVEAADAVVTENLVAKLQQFRSELSTEEQEIFDRMTAAAAGDTEPEVHGFFFQEFFKQFTPAQRKTKDYDFSADTIEGDLVKPEGT